ncbi:hypothetical protein [Marichromatium sp. AB31]|uniref:hypothetical protein n=1 Tax=Marichromatium sp. AB31 TaxID=2483362 RepID=UPI001CC20C71|nr:hypothetical protein [Marichromatium sp. AB31]
MQALIMFFAELCWLRRTPQQLPASETLFVVVLLADLLVGMLVGVSAGIGWWPSLLQALAEIVLTLAALYVGLSAVRHARRFLQTATALLGAGALLGLLALVPLGLQPTGSRETELAALGALLFLALVVWSLVVTGHILRHAFVIGLGQGVAIALAFELFAVALIGALFGGG